MDICARSVSRSWVIFEFKSKLLNTVIYLTNTMLMIEQN
jgi:hypothetical protein